MKRRSWATTSTRARLLLPIALVCVGCAPGIRGQARPVAGDDVFHTDVAPALLRAARIDADALRCNRDNRWGGTLKLDAEAGARDVLTLLEPSLRPLTEEARLALGNKLRKLLFWRMVRSVLLEGDNDNLGVIALRGRTYVDDQGVERPVLIFRTGFTPRPEQPGSCFRSLLEAGGVKHVVNLFDGDIPAEDLVAAESAAASRAGATYHTATDDDGSGYGPWRDTLRKHYDEPDRRAEAMRSVARLIREQILLPGGAPPRGNLHVHCGGGMHRTGMIVGVIERCIDGEPADVVEAHYKYHVGWRDPEHPGGLEEHNLRFIRDFDCALLER